MTVGASSGPSMCPMMAGLPPSLMTSTVRPSARNSTATASALASTFAWSKAASETLGIRVSASRSSRNVGRSSATRAFMAVSRAGSRSGVRTSLVTFGSYALVSCRLPPVWLLPWLPTGDTREASPTTYSGIVFGRKKNSENGTPSAITYAERPGAKNRPTPSRRDQEAANKRPLVPTDRKAAASQSREANKVARAKQRAALLSGDEHALPARDKGPIKRYIRDAVDTRWNVGEFMLPVMVVVLALTFLAPIFPALASFTTLLIFTMVYGLVAAGVLDAFFMWRRIKAKVIAKFGENPPRGSATRGRCRAPRRRSLRPRSTSCRGCPQDLVAAGTDSIRAPWVARHRGQR